MPTTPITTLKNWFKTGLKPTQSQFWAWLDSYWHKSEAIPAASIEGLQLLLDGKMDKKAVTASVKAGPYVPGQAYVFDALVPEYVSFSNPASPNPDFVAEGWYRLTADATGSQTPETAPECWAYNGRSLGEITVEDVFGLREELDRIAAGAGTSGEHTYTIDFYTTATMAQDINMLPAGTITAITARNITNVWLTYSGGTRVVVDVSNPALSISTGDVLTWEIGRTTEGELAALGITLKTN